MRWYISNINKYESICDMLQDSMSFGELIYDLCEVINKDMAKNGYNTSNLAAMDIGCGYHSYMFGIARWQLQVGNQ